MSVLAIQAAHDHTVEFEGEPYIRLGRRTEKLREYPAIESEVWARITTCDFERISARDGLALADTLALLDCPTYFELLDALIPPSYEEVARYLCEDGLLVRQDGRRYAVTNLGALLLARRLKDFPSVARKALRLIQYEGRGRTEMLRSKDFEGGYAVVFEDIVEMLQALAPAWIEIVGAVRCQISAYPERIVRELIAHALAHQDFAIKGCGPVVEVFADRVDVTYPGTLLVDPMRLVDDPHQYRNPRLAGLTRRFRFCEEPGCGWSKIVSSCEASHLSATKVVEYEGAGGSVRVSLMSGIT